MHDEPTTGSAQATQPRAEWLLVALLAAAIAALFHFQGNASFAEGESPSLFVWIGHQWFSADSDFAHAWIMPLVSLWLVWRRRRELAAAAGGICWPAAGLVAAAFLLHAAGMRTQQPRVSLVALTGMLFGIPWLLLGTAAARQLAFPAAYLLLCFLSSLLVNITFTLRLFASAAAAFLLNGLGIAAERSGTAIHTAAGGGLVLDVADPCSGLRSLVVLTAIAAPYAYLSPLTPARKWILFLAAVPVAVAANMLRIMSIGIAAQALGRDVALRLYHDGSGYLVFTVATLLLVIIGEILRRRQPGGARPS